MHWEVWCHYIDILSMQYATCKILFELILNTLKPLHLRILVESIRSCKSLKSRSFVEKKLCAFPGRQVLGQTDDTPFLHPSMGLSETTIIPSKVQSSFLPSIKEHWTSSKHEFYREKVGRYHFFD